HSLTSARWLGARRSGARPAGTALATITAVLTPAGLVATLVVAGRAEEGGEIAQAKRPVADVPAAIGDLVDSAPHAPQSLRRRLTPLGSDDGGGDMVQQAGPPGGVE